MRNLKRVLSLALATAMLFSMMVIGASAANKTAADLTDSAKITNKEAVTLLVDLGIIEGKPDGSYAPAETVNRATMAKLITYIMMGDVDQNAFKGTITDLKDINGHWAEGYIKYCYSNGIIAGDGAGHFMPDQPVTTVAAAKMLLVAIGYDAKNRGYEGSNNWAINIMRDAQTTVDDNTSKVRALTKGLNVKATDALSRDNAAQMIFNALFAENVKPEYAFDMGVRYISKYIYAPSMSATIYNGLTRKVGTLKSVDTVNGLATIGATPLKLAANTSDVGASVVYYVDSTTPTAKLISTAAVAGISDALATSTKGTSYKNLTTKGESGYIGYTADASVAVYYNGAEVLTDIPAGATVVPGTLYVNRGANKVATWADNTLLLAVDTTKTNCVDVASKIGVSVEFYDNGGTGKYDTVKYVEYAFSQVSVIKAATAAKEAEITLKGESAVKKSQVVGDFDGLKVDDYVLYAMIGDQLHVYKPETFEGQMTAFNASKSTMTVSGSTYTMANTVDEGSLSLLIGAAELVTIAAKKDATFYVDNNGYLVASKAVTADVKYAIVDKIAMVGASGTGTSKYLEAVLAFADGTTETVKVSKINGVKAADMTNSATGALTIASGVVTAVNVDTSVNDNAALTGLAVSYSVTDGKYELTYLNLSGSSIINHATSTATGHASTPGTVKVVTKGVPTVIGYNQTDANAATSPVANNKTVYLVKTGNSTDGFKFASYTGFQNVPSITIKGGAATQNATATVSYAVNGSGAVTFIYINAVDTQGTTSTGTAKAGDMAYILNAKYTTDNSGDDAVYIFDAIVNGQVGTVSTKSTTVRTALVGAVDALVELTVKDGDVTAATVQAATGTTYVAKSVTADAKNGVVEGYTYNGTEKVYVINDGDLVGGSVESAKAGDTIYVKVVDKTDAAGSIAIDTIYIVKAAV